MQKKNNDFQSEMIKCFDKQLKTRISRIKKIKENISVLVGVEIEYFLLDSLYNPLSQNSRDRVIENVPYTKREIGASQIEYNSIPISIENGVSDLYNYIKEYEKKLSSYLKKNKSCAIRIGCYPGSFKKLKITDEYSVYQSVLERYKVLRPKYMCNKIGKIDYIDRMHEMIAGCQSFQFNIEVNYNIAYDLLNKLIEVSPFFLALGVNSPIMNNEVSDYLELRNIIWENGYDFRKIDDYINGMSFRTGFPNDYYRSMEDYWNDMKSQVYMKYDVEHSFEIQQKMFWRIARIKLHKEKCLLEVRFLPIQSTIEEDLAISLSIYAFLSIYDNSVLTPISFVIENFRRVSKNGTNAKVYTYNRKLMTIEEKNIKDVLSEIIDNVVNFWIKKSEETGLLIKHILTERLYGEVPAKKEIDYFRTESKMKFYEHYKI